jgi:hypothetical protein
VESFGTTVETTATFVSGETEKISSAFTQMADGAKIAFGNLVSYASA